MKLEFVVNYKEEVIEVDPGERLLDVLRNKLGLTSVKEGCGEGECGACTIIMDGVAVTSCTVLAMQAKGREIITTEGLEKSGELDELQESFMRNGAIQCGFCTPGMLMSCKALLMKNPNPTEAEIRRAIEGNLCRCTGYTKIVNSVKDVIKK
ncbi:(2Fe-2S)-binding protein [Wukongibacter baidiensis]|uniref:(2Fe-2S)-binding protein n=1 Tax=Wukongibacter baidiensis TaxID=1723361 RepID=UPI003D7FD1CF